LFLLPALVKADYNSGGVEKRDIAPPNQHNNISYLKKHLNGGMILPSFSSNLLIALITLHVVSLSVNHVGVFLITNSRRDKATIETKMTAIISRYGPKTTAIKNKQPMFIRTS